MSTFFFTFKIASHSIFYLPLGAGFSLPVGCSFSLVFDLVCCVTRKKKRPWLFFFIVWDNTHLHAALLYRCDLRGCSISTKRCVYTTTKYFQLINWIDCCILQENVQRLVKATLATIGKQRLISVAKILKKNTNATAAVANAKMNPNHAVKNVMAKRRLNTECTATRTSFESCVRYYSIHISNDIRKHPHTIQE